MGVLVLYWIVGKTSYGLYNVSVGSVALDSMSRNWYTAPTPPPPPPTRPLPPTIQQIYLENLSFNNILYHLLGAGRG